MGKWVCEALITLEYDNAPPLEDLTYEQAAGLFGPAIEYIERTLGFDHPATSDKIRVLGLRKVD